MDACYDESYARKGAESSSYNSKEGEPHASGRFKSSFDEDARAEREYISRQEAKAEAESIRDEIKAEMVNRDTEELEVGSHIIRYTSVLSNRFDSSSFKKLRPFKLFMLLRLPATASTPPASRRPCPKCIRRSPSRPQAAGSPSHKKSPLPDSRPKQQARGLDTTHKGEAPTL